MSRRSGIGFTVARGLLALGADVLVHHHAEHDAAQPWGADDVPAVVAALDDRRRELGAPGALHDAAGDLTAPGAPERLVAEALARFGRVDVLVANHARSAPDAGLGGLTVEILDGHWAVDARSVLLLVQAFAGAHDGGCGRVVLMTSGQVAGPLPGEVAYAAAKAALAGITPTLADELADRGITLNTVNPGPVDTGYATGAAHAEVARRFPGGRWATPDDPARLITWLCTDDAAWVTGQVISTEGGFRR